MVNFIVGVTEQVSETNNGVVAILDELGLGTVTNVLYQRISDQGNVQGTLGSDEITHDFLSVVGDGTCNLPFAILVGDTAGVTFLADNGDRGVRLAKVDT